MTKNIRRPKLVEIFTDIKIKNLNNNMDQKLV